MMADRLKNRHLLKSSMITVLAMAGAYAADPVYLSPIAIAPAPDGKTLYVAEQTAGQVAVLDVEGGQVTDAFNLKQPVRDVAVSADGTVVYAVAGDVEGVLCRIELPKGKMKDVDVGHTPTAVALSPDGTRAYVCVRFSNEIAVIDLEKMKEVNQFPAVREPVATVVSADGGTLFVANHLPSGPANGEYAGAQISVYNTADGTPREAIRLPNGSTGLRGICLSPDGKNVYVTHILARYQLPTTQLERGWMNTNALTIIDAETAAYVNTVLLDNVDLGAANPWGVTCTADGKLICVAQAGTQEVAVIDRAVLHERLEKAAKGERVTQVSDSADDVPNDLSFLVGYHRRLRLAGNGPRGIAVIGQTVYTTEYFTDSIGVVQLDPEVLHRPKSLPLGPEQPLTQERRGEMYFNDAGMCFQKWQSCATCHPDGRADGLNWDLLNDGMGNPKQTKSLLYSHRTPPVMITGVRGDAETAVRSGLRYIQFAVRPEEDSVAIDAFLKSMEPVPSPYLKKGKLTGSAKRGMKVFEKAGCAACHPAPLYTDMKLYDVGIGIGREEGQAFDTPTLIENWRTAPFLYDGRAATMQEVLTTFNKSDKHGHTTGLTEEELADLTEFILSQ